MAHNFLDLEEKFRSLGSAKFVVLPIPYEGTVSYLKGTAKAPQAVIAASQQIELFDETLLDEFHHAGVHTTEPIPCQNLTPEQAQQKIYEKAHPLVQAQKFALSLGGEHSITAALVKAVAQSCANLSVLQIDAHADLRDEYQGEKFSHACIMRRIFDMNIPAVAVGIRSLSKEQYEFIARNKLKVFTADTITDQAEWIADVTGALSENVYITLDADALDPAYMPGTGAPEPGGLTYRQVTELILAVGKNKNIVGADIVEVIPSVGGAASEFTAARIAYKIIAAAQLKK